jgi:transcriptional accessory protein Tex/SPT6
MTELLSKAFQAASKLSKRKQTILAKQLLEDILNEKEWEKEFKNPQNKLSEMADLAIKLSQGSRTKKMGMDKL